MYKTIQIFPSMLRLPTEPQLHTNTGQLQNKQLLLMRSAGGAITSVDKISGYKDINSKSTRLNQNAKKSRTRGEMKLLERYIDELRRNKSSGASTNAVQSAYDLESIFAEGGVKIGTQLCFTALVLNKY